MSYLRDFFKRGSSSGSSGGNADVVAGFIQKLAIDCNSDTQVVIKSGSKVGADDGSEVMSVTGDITLSITSSGAGGLDTGSEASDTWYYIWLIKHGSSGNLSGILSTSSTSPTMPSSYTKKRWIGAVRNDSSSNFLQFTQVDRKVLHTNQAPVYTKSDGTTSWVAVSFANYVPPISRKIACSPHAAGNVSGSGFHVLYCAGSKSGTGSGGIYITLNSGSASTHAVGSLVEVLSDSSQVISLYTSNTNGDLYLYSGGFELSI